MNPATQSLQSMLAALVADEYLALSAVALAADLLAADARYNYWFGTKGKQTLSDDAADGALEVLEKVLLDCQAAIAAYKRTRQNEPLEAVLRDSLASMQKLLGSTVT